MKKIYCDISKCLGCRSCELACAVEHSKTKILERAIYETPLPEKRVSVEQLSLPSTFYLLPSTVPLQCRHCEDAPCVKICPTKSMEKMENGIVLHHDETCIGCKWCIIVCPFGIPKTNKAGKTIIKCDLCIERLKNNESPICVSACPTKALKFKEAEEIAQEKKKKFLVEFVFSTKL
ncbi:MAG: 4Fe-4S dicluster domain-containing protein [Elusimicrobiota bacterium]